MRVIYSKTGSDGNCTAIESDSGELLIVDCGIPSKQVNKQVGYRALSAIGVLLTHAHTDHIAAHKEFSSASVTLYAPDTEPLMGDSTAFQKRYYKTVEHGKTIALKGRVSGKTEFLAVPFRLVHRNAQDGSDCPCVGYLISEPSKEGDKLLIATDTAFIGMEIKDVIEPTFQGHRFPPCNIYMLESNYVRLEDSFETLKGTQLEVEKRRVSSHVSAQTASSFIGKQDLSRCREIYLIHVSHSATESDIIEMVRMFREAIENNATATQERKKEIKIYARGKVYQTE